MTRGTKDRRLRIIQWLFRSPYLIFLRVYDQVIRIIRGSPIFSYSRITRNLYVGGQHRSRGWARMKHEGISAIVNLRREHDDSLHGIQSENYLHLPTRDNTPPSLDQLRTGVNFIQHQIEAGRKVYVHCGVGVGRAPTMVAAYLVSEGQSAQESWQTIRSIRPFIMPMRSQVEQVHRFVESSS